jgi:hypothetical protein
MTHRGGLSLSFIIWRIGGGGRGKFSFALGPKNSLGGPVPVSSDMTTIGINLEQHDGCLIGRNCLQIPEPLFHSLSIGSSCCSHVFMYWLYFWNVECWCSLLVSRDYICHWMLVFGCSFGFFLFSIMPLRFNRRWPSDVRKLNVEHFRENPYIALER